MPKSKWVTLSLGSMLCVITASPALSALPSCKDLDAVVASSEDKFRSISAPDPKDDNELKPGIYLPGAKRCRVDVEEDGYYECYFVTGTNVSGSTVWGPTHLGYVAQEFDGWFAECAGYKGQVQFIGQQDFINYGGKYKVVMRNHLSWSDGIFTVSLTPYRKP